MALSQLQAKYCECEASAFRELCICSLLACKFRVCGSI